MLFYVIIYFYKNYFIFIILFYLFIFFLKIISCSGMFRVPGFIDAQKNWTLPLFNKAREIGTENCRESEAVESSGPGPG